MKRRKIKKTNPGLIMLIEELKKKAWENNAPIWRDVAKRLEKPRRNYAAVNLSKINRHTKINDMVVVPGKVLSMGNMDHYVTVAALSFSKKAVEKIITNGKGECINIAELSERNTKGAGVKIIA
jgi:large subunit ribosomal protein L18e